ncbi:hypothetical protein [Methylomonas methanica]|uniref:Elongation factor-1 alpha n=1 Tax=Methylomonas methanica (strain DSM 25384 / MC09) TaxID=857087 RepID=G0A0I5_METMM|nr:hypothetical protein [Methylomonas methanica]AEF98761.1 hypothetical protein Metme_0312 [Methylomonas methanica MC09]
MANCQRFSDVSVSERILNSLFLLSIALGYLFSLGQVFFVHQGRDGESGLSISDIVIAYHGSPEQTRLAAAINGPMAGNLRSPADKEIILDWIDSGARQAIFDVQVAPILQRDCLGCHSPASGMNLPPLTSYEQVVKLTEADRGASIPSLVRVSHIHLFGIAFILFFVGKLFVLCEIPVWLKRLTIGIPFMSMLTDIFAWYLTRKTPEFAYLLVLSGGLMGLSLNFQILLSLYQMWLPAMKMESLQSALRVTTGQMKTNASIVAVGLIKSGQRLISWWQALLAGKGMQRFIEKLKKLLFDVADSIKNRLPNDRRLF